MLGRNLKSLARANEIAKLDISPNALVLVPQPSDKVMAWYQGSYVAAAITVEGSIPEAVSVASEDFAQLVTLFKDDDEVEVTSTSSALVLKSPTRRASLRYDSRTLANQQPLEITPMLTVNLEAFRKEAIAAIGCVAVTLVKPILTGVRIVGSPTHQKVAFEAADGSSLVFATSIVAQVGQEPFNVISPAKDLTTALAVLDGDTLALGTQGKSLILQGGTAIVRLPLLSGLWPEAITKAPRALGYEGEIKLSPESIKALVQAVHIYKVSNDATLRPVEGGIMLESREGEAGQYQEFIPGQALTRTYTFDVQDLDVAAKIAPGVDIALTFASSGVMARAEQEQRKLFILLRNPSASRDVVSTPSRASS